MGCWPAIPPPGLKQWALSWLDAPQVEPSPRGVSQYVPDGLFLVRLKLVTGLTLLLLLPGGTTAWACSVPKGEIRLDSSSWQ